jgi:hypothetical protein
MIIRSVLALLLCCGLARASVTNWRADKGNDYLQTADNTEPMVTTNWYFYGEVVLSETNDATQVVLTGGNIAGSLPLTQEDEDRWELYVGHASKAELDAAFPSDDDYAFILSGGALGSVTQNFSIGSDVYPVTPYLTGGDFSACRKLDIHEPLELNWNSETSLVDSVYLEILEGSPYGDGDTIFDDDPGVVFTSKELPVEIFEVGSHYTGFLQYSDYGFVSGTGAFGVDGVVAFNTEVLFPIEAVVSAASYDDFEDNSMDSNKWSIAFPPEEAVDTFSEFNEHLEYTSVGTGDTFVARFWDADELSYTQDWSIATTFSNAFSPSQFSGDEEIYSGILVMADGELDNNISVEFIISDFGREAATYVTDDGDEDALEASASVSGETLAVKISFDADSKELYTAYSTGGDYVVHTNYSAAGWGMTDSSVFNPAIFCGNFETEITNGQVYAENFRVYGENVLSNEVEFVDIEFLHSYGDGVVYLPDNFIKVESDTSHRITSVEVTTSGGDYINVPFDGAEQETVYWDLEEPLGFSTSWDAANDGDWTVTYGFNNGTFQSVIVPFMKEDEITALPNFFYKPEFLPPSPVNHSVLTNGTFDLAWTAAGPSANHISVEEITPENEADGLERLYGDTFPGDTVTILDLTIDGPLSTTNYGPVVVGEGLRRIRIVEGYGRAAYVEEGIPYIVTKLCESDILFEITLDLDGDDMDDDWEIEFFGGTNVANGGAEDDFDMDGFSNLEEFIAGINPTNSGSVFAVEEPGPSPAGFVINWTAVPEREYAVYWAKSLSDGFDPVTPGYLPYPQNSYTDTVHTVEGCGFYYIDVRLKD